jgi:heme/copper-type cytochrome/quinol oxidase subunit 3
MSAAADATHDHPYELTPVPTAKLGIWWFLASEVMTFGGALVCFILARIHAGGWEDMAHHVSTTIAAINTVILVTSSFTIVEAHAAVIANNQKRAGNYLLITALLGCCFMMMKAFEYSREFSHDLFPWTAPFWGFYYALTGLHGLHVLGGIVIIGYFGFLALWGTNWHLYKHRVEVIGLYWHFVDLVWIFLFPLVYLS